MSKYKVSLIIPNWNGEKKLSKNLSKVLKVCGVSEFLISDDASTDGSVKLIEDNFPQIKLVKRYVNGGFSSNVNTGVKNSNGDLIFLLNNDAVPSEDCLKYILPHFEDERVFGVGLNSGGGWNWAKFDNGFFWHFEKEKVEVAHETLWASGGSAVFRKSVWDELGGFDELFNPFYEEDADLGYRAWKRGYLNIFEPRAKVEHYKEVGVIGQNFSSSKIARTAQRNALFLIWKNIHDAKMINQHIFGLIRKLLISPGYWLVFLEALVNLPKILKKRQLEKYKSTTSDKELLGKYI